MIPCSSGSRNRVAQPIFQTTSLHDCMNANWYSVPGSPRRQKMAKKFVAFAHIPYQLQYELPLQSYPGTARSLLSPREPSPVSLSPFGQAVLGLAAGPERVGKATQFVQRDRLLHESEPAVPGPDGCLYLLRRIFWRYFPRIGSFFAHHCACTDHQHGRGLCHRRPRSVTISFLRPRQVLRCSALYIPRCFRDHPAFRSRQIGTGCFYSSVLWNASAPSGTCSFEVNLSVTGHFLEVKQHESIVAPSLDWDSGRLACRHCPGHY